MISLAVTVFLLLAQCITKASGGVQLPQKAGEYSKEFFEEHRKNSAVYGVLVRLFSSFMANDGISSGDNISVLDVGCGHGLLVEAWRSVGVAKSYCLEGSIEAASMWPQEHKEQFYRLQDLEAPEVAAAVVATDYVTSFEVAEHLRPESANHFVGLLTMHHPKLVFFGAATPFQDRGMNPTHLNENTFRYWIDRFASRGYHVDWARTARAKHVLVTQTEPDTMRAVAESWWYPKNLLIFAPNEARDASDRALLAHPTEADMLNPAYLNMWGEEKNMWKDDWMSFGFLFYEARNKLLSRDNAEF
mmetsp:Transcript_8229/g.15380  ORF Transcript_8229/g.15380 Transcript_8229/m.15380 type:complete len:303 (+) Transcript_8229:67-975(+)